LADAKKGKMEALLGEGGESKKKVTIIGGMKGGRSRENEKKSSGMIGGYQLRFDGGVSASHPGVE